MSSSPTEPGPVRSRGLDAADGDLGRRGDDPRVAQAAGRLGRGRRDDLRGHHRQGRRRDPVARQPAGSTILVEPGDDSRRWARRWPRSIPSRPARRTRRSGTIRRTRRARWSRRRPARPGPPTRGDGRGRSDRFVLAGRSPDRRRARRRPRAGRGHRDRRPGPQARRARATSRPRTGAGGAPARQRAAAHPSRRTSPRPRSATAEPEPAGGRRRAPRADVADAPGDRQAHGREPPHLGPLHDDRRGRLLAGSRRGGPSCKEAMARRGVPLTYLAFVARATVEALQRVPVAQRVDRGRRDRLPRRRQPRDRGRARGRPDRAGDPARRSGSASRGMAAAIADVADARAVEASSSPTTCTAAPSRSPTRASSAPCSRRRSSTSRRSRSSTSRRSSSGRSWSTGRGRRDRDPADDLPPHVLGPPGARRRRGGAVPRREVKRSGSRSWEAELMAVDRQPLDRRREPATLEPRCSSQHEELVVRRGARSGVDVIVAVHSTALGPALGGVRMWHYAATGDGIGDALRLARGDDAEGRRRRARPRRRQGRDLRAARRPPPSGERAATRRCSTSATWSSRWAAATSPPRTSAPTPTTWR